MCFCLREATPRAGPPLSLSQGPPGSPGGGASRRSQWTSDRRRAAVATTARRPSPDRSTCTNTVSPAPRGRPGVCRPIRQPVGSVHSQPVLARASSYGKPPRHDAPRFSAQRVVPRQVSTPGRRSGALSIAHLQKYIIKNNFGGELISQSMASTIPRVASVHSYKAIHPENYNRQSGLQVRD